MASPLDSPGALPPRPARVLSNSAAEFVETRAAAGICRQASAGLTTATDDDEGLEVALASVKFVPQLDVFMVKDEAPDVASYYQDSTEMLAQFRQTLESFTQTLQSRGIFTRLGIEPCDPAKCDIHYVLNVARAIREHKEGAKDTRAIKRFMERCSKRAAANKATISALLSMVPNDIYGSVISGGLSLILAAVEKHESNRAEIQSALAEIPRKLDAIHRLAEVSIKWPTMHRCADQIFLSIFIVLERIIDHLTKSTLQKGMSKIKGRGGEVSEAIETLGIRVKEFQDEATTCSQILLGRTHEGVQLTQVVLSKTYDSVQDIQNHLVRSQDELVGNLVRSQDVLVGVMDQILKGQKQTQTGQDEVKKHLATMCTALYSMLTAETTFNPANGTYIRPSVNPGPLPTTTHAGPLDPPPDREQNTELVEKWFRRLGAFEATSKSHIDQYLSGFSDMSPEEMDRTQWIIASTTLSSWASANQTRIMEAHSESIPDELMNCLSFVTATLALSLAEMTDSVVLSCFCDKRSRSSRSYAEYGPMSVWNSLNGQLLKSMASAEQTADLSFLEERKLLRRSQTKTKYARALFKEMLAALPEGSVVFIMIDFFTRTSRSSKEILEGEDLMEDLIALTRKTTRLVIKLLVTNPRPTCGIRKAADLNLYVPDEVDGWSNGVCQNSLDRQKTTMIEKFAKKKKKKKVVSESEDSSSKESGSDDSESDLE